MYQTLRALVLMTWSFMSSDLSHTRDAPAIADALATVAVEDADKEPILESHELDLVLQAVYVAGESNVNTNPPAQSWDAKDLLSCGMLQERCVFVRSHSLIEQARYWRTLLRAGKKSCPDAPAAPLGGHCKYGRWLADKRMAMAKELLHKAMESGTLNLPVANARN